MNRLSFDFWTYLFQSVNILIIIAIPVVVVYVILLLRRLVKSTETIARNVKSGRDDTR